MTARLQSAPAERNRQPIAQVLAGVLPGRGLVLEIASGTGTHCAFFAAAFPALEWQPSDPDPQARESIRAWCGRLANVRDPLMLDAAAPEWPVERADAMLCINMVHISPWDATLGLLDGAARALHAGAPLVLYGPYRRRDVETAPSNVAFDDSLRARDARWGLRLVEDVADAAAERGLRLDMLREMPANNLTLVFRHG